jgi:signal transduction histidine kinase
MKTNYFEKLYSLSRRKRVLIVIIIFILIILIEIPLVLLRFPPGTTFPLLFLLVLSSFFIFSAWGGFVIGAVSSFTGVGLTILYYKVQNIGLHLIDINNIIIPFVYLFLLGFTVGLFNESRKNYVEEIKNARKKLTKTDKKLKEVDRMRNKFVSHTAHELRTPLNVFRWTLDMLRNEDVGKINEEQRELVEQLHQSSLGMLNLVEDLLEVCRINQKRFKIKSSVCDLAELIDQTLGKLAVEIREKKLTIDWKKPKKKLPQAKADCDRMLQVLLNIIGNAIKYTPAEGKISLSIDKTSELATPEIMKEYKYKQKRKNYLLCSVADTGIGIPKGEQKKMFSGFFRASNAIKTNIGGTGLGMSIVKYIIDSYGGAVWFKSKENQGATFYFTIPTT